MSMLGLVGIPLACALVTLSCHELMVGLEPNLHGYNIVLGPDEDLFILTLFVFNSIISWFEI